MNVMVIEQGGFHRPAWVEAVRERYSSAGVFIVDRIERGADILRSGVDVTAIVVSLPLPSDVLLEKGERLRAAIGGTPPWIIVLGDSDDPAVPQTFRRRGLHYAAGRHDTLRLLDAAWAKGLHRIRSAAVRDPSARSPEPLRGASARQDGEHGLTPRQSEVLTLLNQGKSNKEIARVLDLAEGTVKVHCKAIFRALGVTNRTQAAVLIAKAGFEPAIGTRG